MLCKFTKIALLANLVMGLCAPVQANTTIVGTGFMAPAGRMAPGSMLLAQNDITITPQVLRESSPEPLPDLAQPAPDAALPLAIPAPAVSAAAAGVRTRMALLLPMRSESLAAAAEAVRAGFMAGAGRDADPSMSINLLESGDAAQDVLSAYNQAITGHDIIVGPLTRSGVTLVAQQGTVIKPTIALTPIDTPSGADPSFPPPMVAIGLSLEREARQVATWAAAGRSGDKAFIVTTSATWQRRASQAFATEWRGKGLRPVVIELPLLSNALDPNTLVKLRKRIEQEQPDLMFAALDFAQGRQLREAVGHEVPFFGTSQLNPLALPDWAASEPVADMNGVRLIDIPWQLQADHPAVMAYPRSPADQARMRSADLARLYALGIDAWRVAREIALKRSRFEVDGVTGKLAVDFGGGGSRFERTESPAAYFEGMVVPLQPGQ